MCTRVSSRAGRGTAKVHSGGRMAAGTRESSGMGCSQDGECCTGRAVIGSTREIGTTACSTARAPSTLKMVSGMRAPSRRTNSTGMVSSTKMTQ